MVLAFATAAIWLPWLGGWLAVAPNPQRSDAIVVLGGSTSRTNQAIALYLHGFGDQLWITGEQPAPTGALTFARSMARRAIAGGVPAGKVHLLMTASTWEDGREIAQLARERKLGSILVVTDWYHSRRALCVIRQQLGNSRVLVFYDPPPDPVYGPGNWWAYRHHRDAVLGEYLKLAFYPLRYGLDIRSC
jgi:uncharacterized SAM-binding protein YcdF (DUF218 family)